MIPLLQNFKDRCVKEAPLSSDLSSLSMGFPLLFISRKASERFSFRDMDEILEVTWDTQHGAHLHDTLDQQVSFMAVQTQKKIFK